ncbi:GNAT family N-acetyltransferase [Fibrella sp. HMF5335]|uniref:GNAT family N-acetyltransferase n=1 Tax=Fibrella rubiginis TaxID=2817060 RepID=A0A939GGG7_9BACT|nr:GNAT family N-acetyltransferase [Fibrella rubiginis]MBO0936003.1 GNAT family N-acetyltransferase [Fibrella rubiginis]
MTTPSYSIRKAVAADFEAIDEFDMFAGDRQEEISRGECFVAVQGETVAGYLTTARSFYQNPFIAYIQVRDNQQRHGIGHALLAFAESRWPVEKIYISTEADNAPMLHLLQKRGYTPAGEILFIQNEPELVFCKLR